MHSIFATLMGFRKTEIIGIKYSDIDYIHRRIMQEEIESLIA